jgi:regulatory protein
MKDIEHSPAPITVTAIRESPRRPGRYWVELSDKRRLLVTAGVLSDTGATRVGVVLSEEALDRLAHEAVVIGLMDRALNMLARSRRTRRELDLRLRRGEVEPGLIVEALDRLEAAGVLSDEEVARAEASARLRRGEAPGRVRQQLLRKGVSGAVAREALAEATRDDGFDEGAACRAAAEKRARGLRGLELAVAERRLLGFLLRRGFSSSVARVEVKRVLRGDGARYI